MIDLRNRPNRPLRIGVIFVNSVTEILDVAPVDIFNALSDHFIATFPDGVITDDMRKEALSVEFYWVNETGEPAKLTAGMKAVTTHTFADCPPLDITLMGAHADSNYVLSGGEKDFIQKCSKESAALLFICGGCITALQAGLLDGKTATGPRFMLPILRNQHPKVTWVEKRWNQDGKIWTSGTLLNGTDMMAAFVKEYFSSGEGSLIEFGLRLGAYPERDVDFADVPWKF